MNKIGELIIQYRKENNITQKELAKILGVSNTAISKWECGNNLPDISMLKPLSKILKVPILTLIDCEEEAALEQKKRKLSKKSKIIITICSVLIFLSLISTTIFIIRKNKKEENNVNETLVYKAYSTDENLVLNAYIIIKDDNILTILNNLDYNNNFEGTNNKLLIKELDVKITIDDNIIYNGTSNAEDKKYTNVNDLIENFDFIHYEKFSNKINSQNIEQKSSNIILTYQTEDKKITEHTYSIKLTSVFS